MVKVTSGAPVEAPNSAQPSSSRTTVGRIVLTARFSKAARVTSATMPTTTGRLARDSRRTGSSTAVGGRLAPSRAGAEVAASAAGPLETSSPVAASGRSPW